MRNLLIAVLLLAASLPSQATTLKIATIAPEGSGWMKAMRASAAEIAERTDGRVKIKYYGGGIKGNDAQVLSQIRIGNLQGGAVTPAALINQYPDLNLYGLPMVFDSEEEAAFVRSRLDDKLIAGLEKEGWVAFGFAAGGFSVLMSNKPVRTFDDLKGKKIWIPEGDGMSMQAMKALSLSPVPLPLMDVLTGLQTGLIDIVPMSPIGALVLQWHTKLKYVTELPLMYTYGFMVVQKRAFDKLSDEDQAVVREVMDRTYRELDEQNLVDNREAFQALLNAGLEISDVDRDEYDKTRDALKASTEDLRGSGLYTPELYDEMLGYIEEFRSEHTGE